MCLCTNEQQFGFKRRHSTDMCTMVLKETLSYYTVDGGVASCTLLDATKAFDRVNYCKLFRLLMQRNVTYLRVILDCCLTCTLTVLRVYHGMVLRVRSFLFTMAWDKVAS